MPKPKAQTKRKGPGRPKVAIDWQQVGRMLEAGATAEGIAATVGCDTATLYRRCETDNKINFATFSQQKRAKGDELLRVAQFKQALGGNTSMLIWLGKQRLGQSDKTDSKVDVTVAETNVIRPQVDNDQKAEGDADSYIN